MQPSIIADLKDLERLTKLYPEASAAARESRITEAILLLEREVKDRMPVGAGPIHLRDTMFHSVDNYGAGIQGIRGTPAIHGEPVEYGTRPHFPPVAPILHWVENKLRLTGKAARSVAFLIARKISRSGTKGQLMFTKGFKENEAAVIRILEQIPGDIVKAVSA